MTSCDICIERKNKETGEVFLEYINNQFDGYIVEGVGEDLFKLFNSKEIVEKMISYGDVLRWGTKLGIKHPYIPSDMYSEIEEILKSNRDFKMNDKVVSKELIIKRKEEDWITFYNRDAEFSNKVKKIKKNTKTYEDVENEDYRDYTYVFRNDKWYVYTIYDHIKNGTELNQELIDKLKKSNNK